MDRTLYQLTVLAASSAIAIIALSAGFSTTETSNSIQQPQRTIEITKNITH